MEPATMTSLGYGQKSGDLSELHTPSPGAHVRILSGDLHGWEGTVICWRGNDRLLIKPRGIRDGICVEIDAQVIRLLDGSDS